jgi:hypothetical protein
MGGLGAVGAGISGSQISGSQISGSQIGGIGGFGGIPIVQNAGSDDGIPVVVMPTPLVNDGNPRNGLIGGNFQGQGFGGFAGFNGAQMNGGAGLSGVMVPGFRGISAR